jgi:hypothetical protein
MRLNGFITYLGFILLSIIVIEVQSQSYCDNRYDYVWIMGGIDIDTTKDRHGGFAINFNTSPPTMPAHPKYVRNPFQNVSMSNKFGELMFYSNGCLFLDGKNEELINGDSLNSSDIDYGVFCPEYGYGGHQNMICIPDSYIDSVYHVFYLSTTYNSVPDPVIFVQYDQFNYAKIIMSSPDEQGLVLIKNFPIFIDTAMIGTPVTATKHANGLDWWIITPNRWTNSFNIILLEKEGPVFTGRQYIGDTTHHFAEAGQGKFSQDGQHFAWFHPLNGLFLYDFDRTSGTLSNFRRVVTSASTDIIGGCEFSPSGRFIYVNTITQLYQVDLADDDLQASLTLIAEYDGFGDPLSTRFYAMERTPDDRIFMNVTNGSQWLHIIQQPDKKGLDCRFEQHTLKFPFVNNFTLPHFPNYRLGALEDPLCDSMMVSIPKITSINNEPFIISPNPVSELLYIKIPDPSRTEGLMICLSDLNGQIIARENDLSIDVRGVPSGLYFVLFYSNGVLIQQEKVVVQH